MRMTREKAAENRARIVATASRLFREKGFDGVGLDAIMKEARPDPWRLLWAFLIQGRSRGRGGGACSGARRRAAEPIYERPRSCFRLSVRKPSRGPREWLCAGRIGRRHGPP